MTNPSAADQDSPNSRDAAPGDAAPGDETQGDDAPIEEARKLTLYFGERTRRSGGSYLADDLLELFGRHEIATSVLLRGIEGFGIRHRLRSDRSLSLSEDPPMVAMAVDTAARIDDLIADADILGLRGLVTAERARLLRPGPGPVARPGALPDQVKLTVYLGRQERVYGVAAYRAVCELLHRRGVAGASVLLGVDGTTRGVRHRARFLDANTDVPMIVVAVGDGSLLRPVIGELGALLPNPLLTVERVQICKRDGVLLEPPRPVAPADVDGLAVWQKITLYASESALHEGTPLHRGVVRGLRSSASASGVTALRGVWGFHGDHRPRGDTLLQVHRNVPVMTVVVDDPERIAASFDVIDEFTAERGLVTCETVPALVSVQPNRRHGGLRLARHSP